MEVIHSETIGGLFLELSKLPGLGYMVSVRDREQTTYELPLVAQEDFADMARFFAAAGVKAVTHAYDANESQS